MNDNRNPEELLKDVFAPPDSFRSELLGQTLSAVQRKKQQRRLQRQVSVFALVLTTTLVAFKFFSRTDSLPSVPAPSNPLYVHSQPLPDSMVITTRETIPVLIHSSSSVSIFQTASHGTYELIGEDKLFSLLGDRPVMIVHHGPGDARFSFLNGDDQAGWPVQ